MKKPSIYKKKLANIIVQLEDNHSIVHFFTTSNLKEENTNPTNFVNLIDKFMFGRKIMNNFSWFGQSSNIFCTFWPQTPNKSNLFDLQEKNGVVGFLTTTNMHLFDWLLGNNGHGYNFRAPNDNETRGISYSDGASIVRFETCKGRDVHFEPLIAPNFWTWSFLTVLLVGRKEGRGWGFWTVLLGFWLPSKWRWFHQKRGRG